MFTSLPEGAGQLLCLGEGGAWQYLQHSSDGSPPWHLKKLHQAGTQRGIPDITNIELE